MAGHTRPLSRVPVVSIALIRGRATGNGSEIALACDMSFASREKAILSQWEVGVGLVAGGGPMARLPRLMGRRRALEVLLSSNDIGGDLAEAYGYVNRSLPDGELDGFVDALATRIASFDRWAIANTKRLVNAASLPPDVEIAAGWDACMTSITRPASQERIKALLELGLSQAGRCRRSSGISHRATRALCTRESDVVGPSSFALGEVWKVRHAGYRHWSAGSRIQRGSRRSRNTVTPNS